MRLCVYAFRFNKHFSTKTSGAIFFSFFFFKQFFFFFICTYKCSYQLHVRTLLPFVNLCKCACVYFYFIMVLCFFQAFIYLSKLIIYIFYFLFFIYTFMHQPGHYFINFIKNIPGRIFALFARVTMYTRAQLK